MKELGERVENFVIQQPYFACLNPNFGPKLARTFPESLKRRDEEVFFLRGYDLCCESMTDSNIVQGNRRLHVNKEFFVVETIKDTMVRL